MEKTEEKMVRKRRYLTPEAKYQIFLEGHNGQGKRQRFNK